MFPFLVEVLTVLILLYFLPPIQEHCHWLKLVGIRISVVKVDVDYGMSMSVL